MQGQHALVLSSGRGAHGMGGRRSAAAAGHDSDSEHLRAAWDSGAMVLLLSPAAAKLVWGGAKRH